MRFSLKGLKTYPRLSEETLAYNATLYADGVKVASCENTGKGGCDSIHFVTPKARAAVTEAAVAFQTSRGEEVFEPVDALISALVLKTEDLKLAKKNAKKGFPVTVLMEKGWETYTYALRSDSSDTLKQFEDTVLVREQPDSYRFVTPADVCEVVVTDEAIRDVRDANPVRTALDAALAV